VGFDRGSVSRASGEAGSGAETMSKVAGVQRKDFADTVAAETGNLEASTCDNS